MRGQLHRTGFSELNEDQHFMLEAVHDHEFNELVEYINVEANGAMSAPDATPERALAQLPGILARIRAIYAKDPVARDPELLKAAGRGELTKYLPSSGAKIGFLAMAVVAALAELALGLIPVILDQGSAAVILIAVLLVVAGGILGWGLAGIFKSYIHHLPRDIDRMPPPPRMAQPLILVIVGGSMAVVLAGLRALGGDDKGLVIAITLSLALLVAVCEAFYIHMKDKYEYIRRRMYDCQIWYATDEHSKHCGDSGSFAVQFKNQIHGMRRP